MVDLKRRQKVSKLALCGTNGAKFPGIRKHMQRAIADIYQGLDLSMETFPADDAHDPKAYLESLKSFSPGDCATIFTPDDTHFEIALACIEAGLHVLVTKPVVKTLHEHQILAEAAKRKNVLVMVEVHKRFDPIYMDARDKIQNLGGLSYIYAYMSQPKHQLDTFRAWAGKSSDISYYLNSHHVDFTEWVAGHFALPIKVSAVASTGVAQAKNMNCEDTITLLVQWKNINDGTMGHGVYTSSWVAPKSDVHSQQRFFYMGQAGEINVDQAHRGYSMADDGLGYRSVNPLFMKYTPTNGCFSGQSGYGYRSLEAFVDAATAINKNEATPETFDDTLPTIHTTYLTTAILEAGRQSLDKNGQQVEIFYGLAETPLIPTAVCVKEYQAEDEYTSESGSGRSRCNVKRKADDSV